MTDPDLEAMVEGVESFDVDGVFKAPLHASEVAAIKEEFGIRFIISGTFPFDGNGRILGEDAYQQTLQVIRNLARIISGAVSHYGYDIHEQNALDLIRQSRVYVVDEERNLPLVTKAYIDSKFPQRPMDVVGVLQVPFKALVEVSVEAYLPNDKTENRHYRGSKS